MFNKEFIKDAFLTNLSLPLWLSTGKNDYYSQVKNISYHKGTHLWTRDGGAKTPCFGGQLKYLTPPTDPSFLPLGLSSLMPNQSPAQTERQTRKLGTIDT